MRELSAFIFCIERDGRQKEEKKFSIWKGREAGQSLLRPKKLDEVE